MLSAAYFPDLAACLTPNTPSGNQVCIGSCAAVIFGDSAEILAAEIGEITACVKICTVVGKGKNVILLARSPDMKTGLPDTAIGPGFGRLSSLGGMAANG
jgi:hypothetical protein